MLLLLRSFDEGKPLPLELYCCVSSAIGKVHEPDRKSGPLEAVAGRSGDAGPEMRWTTTTERVVNNGVQSGRTRQSAENLPRGGTPRSGGRGHQNTKRRIWARHFRQLDPALKYFWLCFGILWKSRDTLTIKVTLQLQDGAGHLVAAAFSNLGSFRGKESSVAVPPSFRVSAFLAWTNPQRTATLRLPPVGYRLSICSQGRWQQSYHARH